MLPAGGSGSAGPEVRVRPGRGLAMGLHPLPHCGSGPRRSWLPKPPPNAHPTQATSTVDAAQLPLIHLRTQHPLVSVHTGITLPYMGERSFSEPAQSTMHCIYTGTARLNPYTGCRPARVHPAFTLLAKGLCASRSTLSTAHTTHTQGTTSTCEDCKHRVF